MCLHFQDEQIRSNFFRVLRLVHDDLISYASAAASFCAINEQADNIPLREALNKNPTFWNCLLASHQSTAIVSLARLHDKGRNNKHLSKYIQAMLKQNNDCVDACNMLEAAIINQQSFIDKIVNLRHKLFAHTDFHAPLVATFGFDGIEIDDFRKYWDEIMTAMEACDNAMYGSKEHFPKFEKKLFLEIETATLKALPK